ncbi:hypothetical protein [Hydrogenophilus thermoluteolus]|uniref:Uncharacterized protein n=1 Tax=Hydrogenophilus thermoluteolus TaxID=297 RepID=A0A2Z6DY34_HYDTE|nr:hypothetical protein [Hydrogenophilus thermoluteolus]BBD77238.1 hypothetical protein HPTL_0971 [Hydrogenophilus thermoluteolus]
MLYRYTGPLTAMTMPDGREMILADGQTVDAPEDNPVIQTLAALGRLTPEPQPKAKTKDMQPKE